MKTLILKLRLRSTGSHSNQRTKPEMNLPETSMFNENGNMRIPPGWTQIEEYTKTIGRSMPYARRNTVVVEDEQDTSLYRSQRTQGSKQVLLQIDELRSSTPLQPLPLPNRDTSRTTTGPERPCQRDSSFNPYPIYILDEGRVLRSTRRKTADRVSKQGKRLEILYPLFKTEKIEKIERRETKCSTISKSVHVTSHGSRYSNSSLKRKRSVGMFELDGSKYIWKRSPHCQDVQLYEAYMDKRVRRLREKRKVS